MPQRSTNTTTNAASSSNKKKNAATATSSSSTSKSKFNFKKLKGKKPSAKGKNKLVIKFSPTFTIGKAKDKNIVCTIDFVNHMNNQLIYMKGNYIANFFEFVMTELETGNDDKVSQAIKNASSFKVTDDNNELVCNQTEKDGRVSVYNEHCCVICFKSIAEASFKHDAIVDTILNLLTATKDEYAFVLDAYKQVVASLMNNNVLSENFGKIIEGGWKKDLVLRDNGEYPIELVVQKDVACLNNCFNESLNEICSRYFSECRQQDVIDALRTHNVV